MRWMSQAKCHTSIYIVAYLFVCFPSIYRYIIFLSGIHFKIYVALLDDPNTAFNIFSPKIVFVQMVEHICGEYSCTHSCATSQYHFDLLYGERNKTMCAIMTECDVGLKQFNILRCILTYLFVFFSLFTFNLNLII